MIQKAAQGHYSLAHSLTSAAPLKSRHQRTRGQRVGGQRAIFPAGRISPARVIVFPAGPTHKTICAPPRTAFETSRSLHVCYYGLELLKQLQSHHVPASVNISAITVLCTFIRARSMLLSLRAPLCRLIIQLHRASLTHPPTSFSSPFRKQRSAALAFCLENKSSPSLCCAFQYELLYSKLSVGK